MSVLDTIGLISRDIVSLKTNRFQRTYNWEFLLPIIGTIPGELIAPLVQACRYSDYEMDGPASMRSGAYQSFYAGPLKKRPFSMVMLETEEGLVRLYMTEWKKLMLTSEGLWRKKRGGYAQNIIMTYLNAQGYPIRTVNFVNAFPIKFYEADLSYADSKIQALEVQFACDQIQETILGVPIDEQTENPAANIAGIFDDINSLGESLFTEQQQQSASGLASAGDWLSSMVATPDEEGRASVALGTEEVSEVTSGLSLSSLLDFDWMAGMVSEPSVSESSLSDSWADGLLDSQLDFESYLDNDWYDSLEDVSEFDYLLDDEWSAGLVDTSSYETALSDDWSSGLIETQPMGGDFVGGFSLGSFVF